MASRWMIYGANGYTGELTARLAVSRGKKPILAGRSRSKIAPLADELGLECRTFPLESPEPAASQLRDVDVVAHMAGPFSATSRIMVDACLRSRTHYLDITGEIDVFESVLGRDREAKSSGIVLLPGVGFDVVPTDCLAAMLSARLPDTSQLELAFFGSGKSSAGTSKTAVEALGKGGFIRRGGNIVSVPTAWRVRRVPFADRRRSAISVPWGDVSTAWYSTGIPNIQVYMAMPKRVIPWVRVIGRLQWFLASRTIQAWFKKQIERKVQGPTPEEREMTISQIWGRVRTKEGRSVEGTLTLPEGYTFTADSSIRSLDRVLRGDVPAGAHTPSRAFGAEFIREMDRVTVHSFQSFGAS